MNQVIRSRVVAVVILMAAGLYVAAISSGNIDITEENWVQDIAINGDGSGDEFGRSIAIDGDTVAIGGFREDIGPNSDQGAAYAYVRTGGVWTRQARLLAADGEINDRLGSAIAIDGDTIVVGCPADNVGPNNDQGSAYVFVRNGGVWSQQAQLIAPDGASGDNSFGSSVDIDGDTIVIGAPFYDVDGNADQGSAYIFTRAGAAWSFHSVLDRMSPAAGERFGNAVSISGATLAIHSPNAAGPVGQRGSVFTFTRSGNVWTQQGQINPADGMPGDQFGNSLVIEGDTIAATGANATYIFVRDGASWTQQAKLTLAGGLGSRVDLSDRRVIIGAAGRNAVNIFSRTNGIWTEQAQLNGPIGAGYGNRVAISGNVAAVTAPSTANGSSFIYSGPILPAEPSPTPTPTATPTPSPSPTPTTVSVSGRVTTPGGLGLRNAVVILTDSQGGRQMATTSSFGVYSFPNVVPNETYVISVGSKRYRFAPLSMLITTNLTDVDFVGLE